jgi:lysophospholipase L1-like esterase
MLNHRVIVTTTLCVAWMTSLAAQAQPTVVAFGDSTTAPRGRLEVYATILAAELSSEGGDVRVINAGIPGNTTSSAIGRFDKDVLANKPDLVIVQFGINDSAVDVWKKPPATAPRVPLSKYEKNLRNIVAALKRQNVTTVLMTPNPLRWTPKLKELYGRAPYQPDNPEGMNVLVRDYAETVRRIAREEKTGLVDVFAAFLEHGKKPRRTVDELLMDGMHPGARGQRLVADLLLDYLPTCDKRFTRKPNTLWKRSGEDMLVHPLAVDVSHDTANPAVLGPALARLPDGAVMSIYSTPTSYAGPPGQCFIAGRITRDGGNSWEPERELARNRECRASHPTAHTTRDGTVHVFYLGYVKYGWKNGNPTDDTRSDLWTVRSTDGGTTWTKPQMVFRGYTGATNGACESRDGHLIVPFSHYVSNPGRLNARTAVSVDGGKTWKLGKAIDIGGAGNHDGALEPALIQRNDGRIWMLIRTTRGVFWESFSSDDGLTWTGAQPTTIAATSAPGHLARLADGRLALAWNPKDGGRTLLQVALSNDDGRTWTTPFVVAKGHVTYPFLFEHPKGELWIGIMDTHGGWGKSPRARHVKIREQLLIPG